MSTLQADNVAYSDSNYYNLTLDFCHLSVILLLKVPINLGGEMYWVERCKEACIVGRPQLRSYMEGIDMNQTEFYREEMMKAFRKCDELAAENNRLRDLLSELYDFADEAVGCVDLEECISEDLYARLRPDMED